MRYSISRVKTAESCTRKWMAESVYRLPQGPKKGSFVFGTILHREIENTLLGKPVFTGDWMRLFENGEWATLEAYEGDLVRALVKRGVETGVIAPQPGMKIEHEFNFPLPGALGSFTGKIDMLHREGIQDHKSVADWRWAVSEKKLADDLQMLAYGRIFFQEFPEATSCELRHNNFLKDPNNPEVERRKITVNREAVETVWNDRTLPIIAQMETARTQYPNETDMLKVPGPHEKGICRKYGGCPFARVCTRVESVAAFRARMELNPQAQPNPKQELPMTRWTTPAAAEAAVVTAAATLAKTISALPDPAPAGKPETQAERLARRQADREAQVTATTQPSAPAPVATVIQGPDAEGYLLVPVQTDGKAHSTLLAPWRNPGCTNLNCRGRGYTDAGKMCINCSATYKQATGVDGSTFFKTGYPRGRLAWTVDGALQELQLVKQAKGTAKPDMPPKASEPSQTTPKNNVPPPAEVEPNEAQVRAKVEAGTTLEGAEATLARKLMAQEARASARLDGETHVVEPTVTVKTRDSEVVKHDVPVSQAKTIKQQLEAEMAAAAEDHTAEQALGRTQREGSGRCVTLFIGVVEERGRFPKSTAMEDLFRYESEQLTKGAGKDSFYQLNAFDRRDALSLVAVEKVKALTGPHYIFAPRPGNLEVDAMVRAIRPYVDYVFVSVA